MPDPREWKIEASPVGCLIWAIACGIALIILALAYTIARDIVING